MEENKDLAAESERLDDAALEGAAGGGATSITTSYFCPTCGSAAKLVLKTDDCYVECKGCGARMAVEEATKRRLTVRIDGDAHTVSGTF